MISSVNSIKFPEHIFEHAIFNEERKKWGKEGKNFIIYVKMGINLSHVSYTVTQLHNYLSIDKHLRHKFYIIKSMTK